MTLYYCFDLIKLPFDNRLEIIVFTLVEALLISYLINLLLHLKFLLYLILLFLLY